MSNDKALIDLFCGAGGFTLGAYRAGFDTILGVDLDEDITSSFSTNFPHTRLLNCDIAKNSPADLMDFAKIEKGEIAGIVGGPPCQGFSWIGKRNPKDKRNQLVGRFFHYVDSIEPAFFIMENVPGILTDRLIHTLKEGIEIVERKYRFLGPLVLNAASYGAATSRSRVFIIGYRPGRIETITEDELRCRDNDQHNTVFDAIHDLPHLELAEEDEFGDFWARYSDLPSTDFAKNARMLPPKNLSTDTIRRKLNKNKVSGFQSTIHSKEVLNRFSSLAEGEVDKISRCRRLKWDDLCPTLRAGTGKAHGSHQAIRPIHPSENRVIAVREAARIQGFPDWFQFHPTKWHSFRMIGNSVSPYVAKTLLSQIAGKMGIQPTNNQ